MKRRSVGFTAKDAPLRDDVRRLGALVGEVIREQGGERLFDAVEEARRAAIRRREGRRGAGRALEKAVGGLPAKRAEELVRAFSTYFRVVNLAESVHRIRRRRDHLRRAERPQAGSLRDTLRALRRGGLSRAALRRLLDRMTIELVFTAHPSEATRRSLLQNEQRIARSLVDRLDPSRTPPEEHAAMERIRSEVVTAWQTEEHPSQRPTVADEREQVLFFLTDILYRIVPPFYEELEAAIAGAFGREGVPDTIPGVLRFASWVGGDMDGNPAVTSATVAASLQRHRTLIVRRYRRDIEALAGQMTQSTSRVAIDAKVRSRTARYAKLFAGVPAAAVPSRHAGMTYRLLLRLMAARLEATAVDGTRGYRSAEQLAGDLRLIAASLEANRCGAFGVRRALRRVETFGFHLATLDIRQHAMVHRRTVGRGLREPRWLSMSSAARVRRLRRALRERRRGGRSWDDATRATLAVFRTIASSRTRCGPRAIGPYIISMAEGVDDVLSVLLLARWGGLVTGRGTIPLDVAPLFETIADLEAAPGVMRELFADPIYRLHVRRRGDRQTVMIGYSDSNKDSGLAAARWALQRAQENLVRVAREAGVDLTIFHGRGGTISRGGGKTHNAVLAAPAGAVEGSLRVTEQGEMIHAKYGLRGIAMRTLEQTASAVMLASAGGRTPAAPPAVWRETIDLVAGVSRAAYRELVYERKTLREYFRHATPIDVIERMRIGSRPAARRASGGIEDLRAIPWVFAWTQSRHLLPGWYGLGAGLQAAALRQGEAHLADIIRRWPFMRVMIDDAEMVLAKTDMEIAALYAQLAPSRSRRLFAEIRREHERTCGIILRLKGTRALLDGDRTLQRSIRLRNPYVDPMSLLQIDLLRRWRRSGRRDRALLGALLTTVNGIAHGLRNTG